MSTCYYITQEGYKRLNEEIDELENKILPIIVDEVSRARGNGDLSENAEYHAAKDKQRATMKKIGILKDYKVNAQVINCSDLSKDIITFGSKVEIQDIDSEKIKKIYLVGDYEADITNGFISVSAPLGRALLGKREGDSIEVETPSGINVYDIIKIY